MSRSTSDSLRTSRLEAILEPETLGFLGVTLLGGLSILTLHSWGVRQTVVTAIPIALMFLYGGLEYFGGQISTEDLGDRLYYLGFLFTLTSVGYSLWKFEGSDRDVERILANFGVALGTTITGLVLRVVLYQVHEDPIEIERRSRMELREAARELKLELSSCVQDVSSFRRAVLLSIEEGLRDVIAKFSETLQQSAKQVGDAAQVSMGKIDAALVALPSRAGQVSEAADRLVSAISACWEKVEALRIDPDLIATQVKPLGVAIRQHMEAVNECVTAQRDATRKLRKSFDSMEEILGKFNERLSTNQGITDLMSRATEAASSLERFGDSFTGTSNRMLTQLSTSSIALEEVEKTTRSNFEAVAKSRALLEREVERYAEVVAQTERALVSSAELILTRLGDGKH